MKMPNIHMLSEGGKTPNQQKSLFLRGVLSMTLRLRDERNRQFGN